MKLVKVCPKCKLHNDAQNLFCFQCGFSLRPLPKQHLLVVPGDPPPDLWRETYAYGIDFRLCLGVPGRDDCLHVDPHKTGGIILGRLDARTGYLPEVDLAGFGAQEAGVSRQHAVIEVTEGIPRLIDLNSRNHTWLNELRLAPHLPYILREGDTIRLGRLEVAVAFVPDEVTHNPPESNHD